MLATQEATCYCQCDHRFLKLGAWDFTSRACNMTASTHSCHESECKCGEW